MLIRLMPAPAEPPVALLFICGTNAGMAAVSCGNPQSTVGVGGSVPNHSTSSAGWSDAMNVTSASVRPILCLRGRGRQHLRSECFQHVPLADFVLSYLGSPPEAVARELAAFSQSAQVLSSEHPRLVDQYPHEWVAVFDNDVVAHGKELSEVLNRLELKGISPAKTIIRYIIKDGPSWILPQDVNR